MEGNLTALTCSKDLQGGQISETIAEDYANSLIACLKLKLTEKKPSTKFKSNKGIIDHIYS